MFVLFCASFERYRNGWTHRDFSRQKINDFSLQSEFLYYKCHVEIHIYMVSVCVRFATEEKDCLYM